jgi:hypothetical protein
MIGDHHGRRPGGQLCWSESWMRFSARTGDRGDGGDHEDVIDSPVQRRPWLRPPRGRSSPSLSAPRTSGVPIRCASQWSGRVSHARDVRFGVQAMRMQELCPRACPRQCRPGPSSSAGTSRRSAGPLAIWPKGFSCSRGCSVAQRRNSGGFGAGIADSLQATIVASDRASAKVGNSAGLTHSGSGPPDRRSYPQGPMRLPMSTRPRPRNSLQCCADVT